MLGHPAAGSVALGSDVSGSGAFVSIDQDHFQRETGAEVSSLAGLGLAHGAARVRAASELGKVADSLIPVAPQLRPLFPRGGIERGATCSIRADIGAMSLLVRLLVYPLVQEKWVTMVGFSNCGSLAFAEANAELGNAESTGLLQRLVMVPEPLPEVGEVIGTAVDSMDLVVINSSVLTLGSRVMDRLVAKLKSAAALVILGPTQRQPDYECRVIEQRWFGLGQGRGRLREQELYVRSRTKRDMQIRECVVGVRNHASYGGELAG